MQNIYEKMESCFTCTIEQLKKVALDDNWHVRYAAAVAIGKRKDDEFLSTLDAMLEIEDKRPLYSQPPFKFSGSLTVTSIAEQVKPFEVEFPNAVDDETKEAWKCRGRVKQAILFAVYEIGKINESLIKRVHFYVEDESEDSAVKAASLRVIRIIGRKESLKWCEGILGYDEWCTNMEARKAIQVIKNG